MITPVRSIYLGGCQFGSLCRLFLVVLGLWCVHSICLGEACGGVLMPLLLYIGSGNPSMSGVVGIFRKDRDEILYWSSKEIHGWGEFSGGVWGVPVLKNGFLECIDVDCTDSCSWFSIRVECGWSSVQMPAMSWMGMWREGVAVLS